MQLTFLQRNPDSERYSSQCGKIPGSTKMEVYSLCYSSLACYSTDIMEMPCVVSQLTEGLSYGGSIDFRNTISAQRLQPENCVKDER